MDSSISKALIIVSGVLLAMLVIGFVTRSFRQVGSWAETQDQEVLVEQIGKFNKEYEAYDKDLMYGVDVISCLNKALSNNDKISGRFSEQLDRSYEIKVGVELRNTQLEESITVKHMVRESSSNTFKEREYTTNNGPTNSVIKLSETGFVFLTSGYTSFKDSDKLETSVKKIDLVKIGDKSSKLELTAKLDGNKGENEDILRKLLNSPRALNENVINKNDSKLKENSWTTAEYKSYLYDIKTRKFKCTGIEYNPQTSRITSISFKEL